MTIAEKIKQARKTLNLTQEDLAKLINTDRTVVVNWENGRYSPGPDSKEKLSKVLKKPISYFIEEEEEEEEDEVQVVAADMINLSVLARVPAGLPDFSDDDVESHIHIPRYLYPGAKIAVYAKSDSMEPEIMKGDICIVRFEKEPINGKIMLCQIPGEGWVIKRIRKIGSKIELVSVNPSYKPIVPKQLKIIGQVIGSCKRFA